LFKFLNKNKVKRYKEKQNVIIKANDLKYSMKLGGFQNIRGFGQPCFLPENHDPILENNPSNNKFEIIDIKEMKKKVKEIEKKYPRGIPKKVVDNKYYYVKDKSRVGDFANPALNLSLNGYITLTDTWNLGWTFFEIESEQWMGYSILKILKFVGEELNKGRKMKEIFEDDLYETEGTLVAEMLDELAQDDRKLITNIITLMLRNNIEEDIDIDVDEFMYKYLLSEDDEVGVTSLLLSLKMFISTKAYWKTIYSLNANLNDFADNAADKRRQVIFSIMQMTNDEICAKIKDVISEDMFEIVLRKMYLPMYLKFYFEYLEGFTSINVKLRPSLEKLTLEMTQKLNNLKKLNNSVIKKINLIDCMTISEMDITIDNVIKMMTEKHPKFLI
jgi:hypothetical protein